MRDGAGPGRRTAADRSGGAAAGHAARAARGGAAIEARLYAEDPAAGWRPAAGTVRRFAVPGVLAEFAVPGAAGIRLDAGVVDGSVVGTDYDPMLAKVIAWAPTRTEAVARLAAALAGARVHGPATNRDLLVRSLRHPEFLAGRTDTTFFDRLGLDELAAPAAGPAQVRLAALAAALAVAAAGRRDAPVLGGLPSGWRNVPSQSQQVQFEVAGERIEVGYRYTRDGEHVDVDGDGWAVARRLLPRFPDAAAAMAEGSLVAPMPGTVVAVHVAVGDRVAVGQPLLVLEAMKMQHPVVAPAAGVVTSLEVAQARQVDAGTVLAVIEPEEGT